MSRKLNRPEPDGRDSPNDLTVESMEKFFDKIEERRDASREKPTILPGRGAVIRVGGTPPFARVRVTKLGSFNTIGDDSELLGTTVIMWTQSENNHNPFADDVEVRGVLTPESRAAWKAGELSWLSADGEVELIEPPSYVGRPEDFIPAVSPVELPAPKRISLSSDWPSLIWDSVILYYAMVPLDDPLNCLETILCALEVAPPVPELRAFLLAGLKARHKEFLRNRSSYTSEDLRWLHEDSPDWQHGRWTL
jgi:hypothetical protein